MSIYLSSMLFSVIQSLSQWFFNIAEALFSSAKSLILLEMNDELHMLIIVPVILIIIVRCISLAAKGFKITDYFLKNKELLTITLILCIFNILQNQIIALSFNLFDSIFDSTSIVELLKSDFSEENLFLSIITLFSASSAILIALSELLSILSIKVAFGLIPIITLLGFYYPRITAFMLKNVMYGLLYPMMQSFLMYFTLTQLLPLLMSDTTLLSNSIFKLAMILYSYQFAKIISDTFLTKEKANLPIENLVTQNSGKPLNQC